MKRLCVAVGTGLILLGITGCGAVADNSAPSAAVDAVDVADVVVADEALQAIGFEALSMASPTPTPTPGKGRRGHGHGLLRGNTLHGEVVVQTKEGTRTVVVQRGTVTAITDMSITVKSSDGYTLTWAFGDKLRVVERRTTIQPKDVAVGTTVGVAGAKDGDRNVARLIRIPNR